MTCPHTNLIDNTSFERCRDCGMVKYPTTDWRDESPPPPAHTFALATAADDRRHARYWEIARGPADRTKGDHE